MNKTLSLEVIIERLQEWSTQQRLIEQAIKNCHMSLQSNEQDDKKIGLIARWQLSDIQLRFDKQSLVFKHGIYSHPFFDTQIGLYIAADSKGWLRDVKNIGRYHLITSLNGQVEDDYLILDDGYHLK